MSRRSGTDAYGSEAAKRPSRNADTSSASALAVSARPCSRRTLGSLPEGRSETDQKRYKHDTRRHELPSVTAHELSQSVTLVSPPGEHRLLGQMVQDVLCKRFC